MEVSQEKETSVCNFGVYTCDCTMIEGYRDSKIEPSYLTLYVDPVAEITASEQWIWAAPSV